MSGPTPYSLDDGSPTPGFFRLGGEVDQSNVGLVARDLTRALGTGRAVVDLSDLTFIDSAGFKMLMTLSSTHEIALVLSPQAVPRPAMDLLGLKDLIPVFDSVDEATRGFLSP